MSSKAISRVLVSPNLSAYWIPDPTKNTQGADFQGDLGRRAQEVLAWMNLMQELAPSGLSGWE